MTTVHTVCVWKRRRIMKVRILRQQTPVSEPYWESFDYDGPADISVSGLLDYLNYHDDIRTDDGRRTTRIGWECSCMQGVCGACAMVINEVPALACKTFVRDLKGREIIIRPLRKFPVIHDLVIDRTVIQEQLTRTSMFIGEYQPADSREQALQALAARCLKCGLCMEVCPAYGEGSRFYGAAFANDCYLVASRNREKSHEVRQTYDEHFGSVCSKSLSCMTVCPAGIPMITTIAKMNRGIKGGKTPKENRGK